VNKILPSNAILIPDHAKKVFSGVIYDVYQWQQQLFDQTTTTFEMLKRPDTVVTIPVVDNKIVILQDENPHQGKRITFPGGRVEASDSSTLEAAKRETLEESGLSFKNWRLIKVTQPSNEIEWFVYVYLAWGLIARDQLKLDPGERIKVSDISFTDLQQLVMNDHGVLGEDRDIFQALNSLNDLLNLAEYKP
jgi:8-oxo-dGTP pyrophosphatase MutT (NUDIX family)